MVRQCSEIREISADSSGTTLVEYALLVGLIGGAAMVAMMLWSEKINIVYNILINTLTLD